METAAHSRLCRQEGHFWIEKLGLSSYQMAALVWLTGLVIGLVLGLGCSDRTGQRYTSSVS